VAGPRAARIEGWRQRFADRPEWERLDFAPEEYAERQARTRAAMAEAGIDVLLVIDPKNLNWLIGFRAKSYQEFQCLVFPLEDEPLTIQRECESRWVHPHVYDWPEPDSLNDNTGDLPILNWTAGSARDVIAQIRRGWRTLLEKHAGRIDFHPRTLIGSPRSPQAKRFVSMLLDKPADAPADFPQRGTRKATSAC